MTDDMRAKSAPLTPASPAAESAAESRRRASSDFNPHVFDRVSLDHRALLPKRFEVDIRRRYNMDKLVLGEGGYGKVYVACDQKFQNRLVAVKKLTKTKDSKRTDAFHEEIRIMQELDHPNICRLFETFEQGQHLFFIMEYCEGGELFDRIVETGFISERLTAHFAAQVASAITYAHTRKIAHRDIKPENVVLCTKDPGDNSIKVIDWGLSCNFADAPMRTAVGSFSYAAPEVIMSKNKETYSAACDLWSLGVLTYVMLCGKPPFWGNPQAHLKNARAEKYPMEGEPWDDMNPHAKDFVQKLLRAEPSQRMSDPLAHVWLSAEAAGGSVHDEKFSEGVMLNLSRYRNQGRFMQLCITAVARHLDHRHLRDIHQVFREIDTNGDGTLSMEEIKVGMIRMFGVDSPECGQVQEMFAKLDLDGSGTIDYTEFCAAGLGASAATKADVVYAAFKAFDLDDNGRLSKAEIQKILGSADVQQVWSSEVCDAVARDIMERFDEDRDGSIDFSEWMKAMSDTWDKRFPATLRDEEHPSSAELALGRGPTHMLSAYESLAQVNKVNAL